MVVGDTHMFPGFLTPVLTQLFFPKPPTTFLTYFCRGERQKYTGKKSCLNRGSNSQPQGHESDMLTTEPPEWGFQTSNMNGRINADLNKVCLDFPAFLPENNSTFFYIKLRLNIGVIRLSSFHGRNGRRLVMLFPGLSIFNCRIFKVWSHRACNHRFFSAFTKG